MRPISFLAASCVASGVAALTMKTLDLHGIAVPFAFAASLAPASIATGCWSLAKNESSASVALCCVGILASATAIYLTAIQCALLLAIPFFMALASFAVALYFIPIFIVKLFESYF